MENPKHTHIFKYMTVLLHSHFGLHKGVDKALLIII